MRRVETKKCKKILLRGGLIFQNKLLCLHACSTLTHQKKGKNRKHVSEQSNTLKARDQFFLMSLMMYMQVISILAMQFYCCLKMHILESLNIHKKFQEKQDKSKNHKFFQMNTILRSYLCTRICKYQQFYLSAYVHSNEISIRFCFPRPSTVIGLIIILILHLQKHGLKSKHL